MQKCVNLVDLVKSFQPDSYSNEYLLANVGVDTAENGPPQVSQNLKKKLEKHRFKNKTTNLQGFEVLLQGTSMLRKEQEEEARIRDKIMEQRQQLDQTQGFYLDASRALQQVDTSIKIK